MRVPAIFALVLNIAAALNAHAAAGDLTSPSLSMPADTPLALRTNLLAAISERECKFLDGHFINAWTTLNYGGSTEALNHLLARLCGYDGVRLVVTFVKEPEGPAWTLSHNGNGDPGELFIKVNVAATTIDVGELEMTLIGHSKPPSP